ncbi:hypothetical protein SAMN05443270_4828 [Lacrimispora sphenoides]|jgi:hypothetical protein|uniref:hypothetical protein n=1 Tax=Lacrimispora sphenoides TaxID=29370 RepID=UPI0008CF89E6|nr:hypothetical protein [Lacrimispora sphenoides]SEU30033.1 hypothetical protein SAMN05443270_4828 [Lacrimispora sphenoides]
MNNMVYLYVFDTMADWLKKQSFENIPCRQGTTSFTRHHYHRHKACGIHNPVAEEKQLIFDTYINDVP